MPVLLERHDVLADDGLEGLAAGRVLLVKFHVGGVERLELVVLMQIAHQVAAHGIERAGVLHGPLLTESDEGAEFEDVLRFHARFELVDAVAGQRDEFPFAQLGALVERGQTFLDPQRMVRLGARFAVAHVQGVAELVPHGPADALGHDEPAAVPIESGDVAALDAAGGRDDDGDVLFELVGQQALPERIRAGGQVRLQLVERGAVDVGGEDQLVFVVDLNDVVVAVAGFEVGQFQQGFFLLHLVATCAQGLEPGQFAQGCEAGHLLETPHLRVAQVDGFLEVVQGLLRIVRAAVGQAQVLPDGRVFGHKFAYLLRGADRLLILLRGELLHQQPVEERGGPLLLRQLRALDRRELRQRIFGHVGERVELVGSRRFRRLGGMSGGRCVQTECDGQKHDQAESAHVGLPDLMVDTARQDTRHPHARTSERLNSTRRGRTIYVPPTGA